MPVLNRQGLDVDYSDDGEGPAVILIHGGASNNRQWRDLTDQLKDRYRVMAVNLRGSGKTTPWPVGEIQPLEAQTVLIEALVDLVGEPVALVGHSWGATIAMKAALTMGDRLRQMVLVEPNPFFLLKRPGYEDGRADIDLMAKPAQVLAEDGQYSKMGKLFIDYWFGAGSWQAMDEKRRTGITAMMPTIRDSWDGCMEGPETIEAWTDHAARTLLITSADTRLSVRRLRDQMLDHLPGLRSCVTPEGGHMAVVNQPDLVNPDIIRFLDQS